MGRTSRIKKDASPNEQLLTLDQVEASLGGTLRRPGDAAWVRSAAGILDAMSRSNGGAVATLRCERLDGGMRIVDGQDVLLVARAMRARAVARGDLAWAALMGRQLVFRVTVGAAPQAATRRSTATRSMRIGRRALALATS